MSTGDSQSHTPPPGPSNDEPQATPSSNNGPPTTPPPSQDLLQALLQANLQTQQLLQRNSAAKKKIWVTKPDKFDEKIGDYILTWLDAFNKFFEHRERNENDVVDDRERIDIAVNTINSNLNMKLVNYEKEFGQFDSWKTFIDYM